MEDGQVYNRYTITHKDGKPINPDKRYFVLDLSSPDIREVDAISAFISQCVYTGYKELADDLNNYLHTARIEGAKQFTSGQRVKTVEGGEYGTVDSVDYNAGVISVLIDDTDDDYTLEREYLYFHLTIL